MQRVIRTEIYIDPAIVRPPPTSLFRSVLGRSWRAKLNPGISIAWIKTGDVEVASSYLLRRPRRVMPENVDQIKGFIDLCILGNEAKWHEAYHSGESWYLAQEILFETEVVLENSPPFTVSLTTLLNRSPEIVIGTYVGMLSAGDNPTLMLVTVPLGIIAIGSAIGVSTALKKGLNRSVEARIRRIAEFRRREEQPRPPGHSA